MPKTYWIPASAGMTDSLMRFLLADSYFQKCRCSNKVAFYRLFYVHLIFPLAPFRFFRYILLNVQK